MKLKLCPFCAREPVLYLLEHSNQYAVACQCGAEAPKDSKSKLGAQRIWNRRRLESIQKNKYDKVIDALKEKVDFLSKWTI